MSHTEQAIGGVELVPGLTHHTFMAEGGPISIYEAGNTKAPKVVMLHGAMYDEARFTWDQMFPHLSKHYNVFAVDTPRHGKSRPWSGTLDHSRLMNIFSAAFAHLNLNRFSMVGLSMGGALCIEYASLYPDKVVSMALFEPGGLGDQLDHHFITWLYIKTPWLLRYFGKKYAKADSEAMRKLLESIYVGGTKPTDPERLMPILRDEIKGKNTHRENDMDDWQIDLVGACKLKWNLLDRIPRIKCPTLWLRGAESVLVKQHEMERAVQLVQESGMAAELVVVPNAGHLLPLEQPEKANTAVKLFLDKTTGNCAPQVAL